jgi:predicted nucleic acid-binding protein
MISKVVVVDAALIIKAILPNPESAVCLAVLKRIEDAQLVAPALWIYEITSTFSKAVHFEQITLAEGQAALKQALSLGVQIIPPDETQAALAYNWTITLKRAAAYDSFYLAIAEALGAEFWTADQSLFRSLEGRGLAWLHWCGEVQ